jgi:hypothetical protein
VGQPGLPLPVPVRRLVLNDVGPAIEWESLERIGSYVGKSLQFPNFESAAAAMRLISEDSAHIAMSSGAGSRKP